MPTEIPRLNAENLARYQRDPETFFAEQIRTSSGQPFEVQPWEHRAFDSLRSGKTLLLVVTPTGFGKTTFFSGVLLWRIICGGPGLRGHAFAADKDQARLLLQAARDLLNRNPQLNALVKVNRWTLSVESLDNEFEVMASDAPSSGGLGGSGSEWIVFGDEASEIPDEILDAVETRTAKGLPVTRVYISNPGGLQEGRFFELCQDAEKYPDEQTFIYDWFVSGDPRVPWQSEEWIGRQRRILPPHIFDRFIDGRWTDGAGSFLTAEQVAACVDPDWTLQHRGTGGSYICGLDYGRKHDLCAAAIVHRDWERGLVVLDALRVWDPRREGGEVRIADVEEYLDQARAAFSGLRIIGDPWQLASTSQKFGSSFEEFTFSGGNIDKLTRTLYEVASNAQLRIFPDEDLERELRRARIKLMSYGYRLEFSRGKEGHGDRVMALGMAVVKAMEVRHVGDYEGVFDDDLDPLFPEVEVVSG